MCVRSHLATILYFKLRGLNSRSSSHRIRGLIGKYFAKQMEPEQQQPPQSLVGFLGTKWRLPSPTAHPCRSIFHGTASPWHADLFRSVLFYSVLLPPVFNRKTNITLQPLLTGRKFPFLFLTNSSARFPSGLGC